MIATVKRPFDWLQVETSPKIEVERNKQKLVFEPPTSPGGVSRRFEKDDVFTTIGGSEVLNFGDKVQVSVPDTQKATSNTKPTVPVTPSGTKTPPTGDGFKPPEEG